jgi:YD repeat-containing protein
VKAWPLTVVRNDLSPFGIGWFSHHDTLLVDGGPLVTIVQGDGLQVVFTLESDGSYSSPKNDTSTLVKNGDGSWTRTYRGGGILQFNQDGRLTRIEDRYGHFQEILYESNGRSIPAGQWGLTTRIRRVIDTSGNYFDFSYDNDGWLAEIQDSSGRVYGFEHDSEGHLTAYIDPLGQREEFTYDNRHMMTSHTDQRGNLTTYVLDDEGRVLTRTWPTGTNLGVRCVGGLLFVPSGG